MLALFWLVLSLGNLVFSSAAHSSPVGKGDRDQGTFENPSARDRPRFRYWLPDASIEPSILKSDIQAAGRLGMGGIEFVPYYNYGGQIGGPPKAVDWVEHGFGTPSFLQTMEAALEAHDEAGMVMDFAFGPSEGQGVPAYSTEEGLQWDLVPFYESVPSNGQVNKTVIGLGTGSLVAVVSAVVTHSQNVTKSIIIPPLPQPQIITHEKLTLKSDTLVDITDKVDPFTGVLTTTVPVPKGNETVRIFAFWEKRTLKRNLQFPINNSFGGIWANGSYVVDHFSARGADMITSFWDKHILSHGTIQDRLKRVGNVGWEDSVELKSNISWSPTLLDRFENKFGYDLRRYLPLIVFGNNNIGLQSDTPGIYDATLSSMDLGKGFVNDYRSVLADGYVEYLQTLRKWLKETLGLQLSVQPSYNLPIDMPSVIPYVDVPESESLQGSNNIDGYRQFAGPSNLAGNKIISNELGAVLGKGFSLTVPELLHMANRGFAGGLNQYVVHGQPYSGNYPETTWPGHTPFLYHASDMYTTKRPDWEHGLQDAIGYLSRVQYVQRQGIPRMDVAVYVKNVTDPYFATVYDSVDLARGGWSYNYLSPDNLDLPQAVVDTAVLAPEGAAYKAMVIQSTQNLTMPGVRKIKQYAHNGLPIILSGGPPGYYPARDAGDRDEVENAIEEIIRLPSVHIVKKGTVAQKLVDLGLQPRVATQTNGTLYTTWREDTETGVEYLYVFSDLTPATGELRVQSTKIPYVLDPWEGSQTPLQFYRAEDDATVIPVTMAANQTAIFAFASEPVDDIAAPGSTHIVNIPSSVLGYVPSRRGLQLHVAHSTGADKVHLSTGAVVSLNSSSPPAFSLGPWNLTTELWEAPENLYDLSTSAVKRNLTQMSLEQLVPWSNIPELNNASGVCYYSTIFPWSESACGNRGAYISFSAVLNAINVRINGKQLPPLDPVYPVADISRYLRQGENEVVVIVPSTMWNYLRSMIDDLKSSGREPLVKLLGIPPPTENGLRGRAEIIPIDKVEV